MGFSVGDGGVLSRTLLFISSIVELSGPLQSAVRREAASLDFLVPDTIIIWRVGLKKNDSPGVASL